MSFRSILAILLLTIAAPVLAQSMPEGRLLRFPDVSKDKIVFSYGGDLMVGLERGWDSATNHEPSRAGAVCEILAGWKVDRIHRAV